ncbi:multidrug effflux MFS transporter [Desertivirga arenae]|uniref:multidrug effflux MFS transporter n=1 Tax=Desertivirga arenae TaxID=2810309 RepID=UPI001A97C23E|nr:multidrug effflux MFS transporter [Pedobacter sp. SYSU D00823]
MKQKGSGLIIFILGTLTALGPFSIDMYLPGFPAIAKDLNTTVAQVSLSLSSFFIGISFGQLLYGPLLDRYGRKKPLYFGLSLYVIASLACAFSNSIEALIYLRFVQAIGSCAAGVASIAMVRDLFPVEDSARVFSLLMLVVGVSPMVAPTVGGYVTAAFGWQTVFFILTIISAFILAAVYFKLPESVKPDPDFSLKPKPILKNFMAVLKEPQFVTYALTGAIGFAGLFAYVSGSPIVFMEIFQVNEKVYGWIFALLSVGFIGASQVNNLVLKRMRSDEVVLVALVVQSVIGIVFLLGTVAGWFGLTATIIMLFLFLCCLGFSFPNASALSLAPFSKNAGSASALMGALQMAIGSLSSIAISIFNDHTAVPMVGVMATSALLALLVLTIGRKKIAQSGAALDLQKSGTVVIH